MPISAGAATAWAGLCTSFESPETRTRKSGKVGTDGQTAAVYERDLEGNLRSLLDRAKSGRYFAPPVRRAYIPKPGSPTEKRPIGIPTLEDKVLQRAVVMLLEPIYEQDFHDGSYGFRPGRSAHKTLESLWKGTMDMRGGWVLEVDIRKFFDTLVTPIFGKLFGIECATSSGKPHHHD